MKHESTVATSASSHPKENQGEPADGARRWVARLHLPWVRRGVAVLVFVVVLEYLVLPQVAGTRKALHLVGDIRPWLMAIGILLQGCSLASYSLLTRSVLPIQRPSYWWLFRSDLTGLGVSHIVPGGAAASTALRYRLIHEGGAPRHGVVVGTTVQTIGSQLLLVVMLWVALLLSIPFAGVNRFYIVTAAASALAIALIAACVVGLARGGPRTAAVTNRVIRWLPTRVRGRVAEALEKASTALVELLSDRRQLRVSALWATANWIFDVASLWVFLAAYGWQINPTELAVGYALANLLASLPVSPGGLGVIEGVLIPSLVAFGVHRGIAVLGVVSWRLFEFWAPIPVAGLCYVSLRTHALRARGWPAFKSFFSGRIGVSSSTK